LQQKKKARKNPNKRKTFKEEATRARGSPGRVTIRQGHSSFKRSTRGRCSEGPLSKKGRCFWGDPLMEGENVQKGEGIRERT